MYVNILSNWIDLLCQLWSRNQSPSPGWNAVCHIMFIHKHKSSATHSYVLCILCVCSSTASSLDHLHISLSLSVSVCPTEWLFVNHTLGPSSTPSNCWEFTSCTRNCFNRPAKRLHRKREPMLTVTCSYLLSGRNECVEPQGPRCNVTKGQWVSPLCHNYMENGQNELTFLDLTTLKTEMRGWGSLVSKLMS